MNGFRSTPKIFEQLFFEAENMLRYYYGTIDDDLHIRGTDKKGLNLYNEERSNIRFKKKGVKEVICDLCNRAASHSEYPGFADVFRDWKTPVIPPKVFIPYICENGRTIYCGHYAIYNAVFGFKLVSLYDIACSLLPETKYVSAYSLSRKYHENEKAILSKITTHVNILEGNGFDNILSMDNKRVAEYQSEFLYRLSSEVDGRNLDAALRLFSSTSDSPVYIRTRWHALVSVYETMKKHAPADGVDRILYLYYLESLLHVDLINVIMGNIRYLKENGKPFPDGENDLKTLGSFSRIFNVFKRPMVVQLFFDVLSGKYPVDTGNWETLPTNIHEWHLAIEKYCQEEESRHRIEQWQFIIDFMKNRGLLNENGFDKGLIENRIKKIKDDLHEMIEKNQKAIEDPLGYAIEKENDPGEYSFKDIIDDVFAKTYEKHPADDFEFEGLGVNDESEGKAKVPPEFPGNPKRLFAATKTVTKNGVDYYEPDYGSYEMRTEDYRDIQFLANSIFANLSDYNNPSLPELSRLKK